MIKIPEERQHYWSPQLQLTLEERNDGGVRVNGLITPMPSVWTLFAGGYGISAALGPFVGTFGLAQWQLGHKPWALLAFPVAMLLIALLYLAARYGQHLGEEQTRELTGFVTQATGSED